MEEVLRHWRARASIHLRLNNTFSAVYLAQIKQGTAPIDTRANVACTHDSIHSYERGATVLLQQRGPAGSTGALRWLYYVCMLSWVAPAVWTSTLTTCQPFYYALLMKHVPTCPVTAKHLFASEYVKTDAALLHFISL
jgi:hypothetical protein